MSFQIEVRLAAIDDGSQLAQLYGSAWAKSGTYDLAGAATVGAQNLFSAGLITDWRVVDLSNVTIVAARDPTTVGQQIVRAPVSQLPPNVNTE